MNTEQEPEFLLFDSSEHAGENDDQHNLLDYFDEMDSVTLWCSPEDLCQVCFQQEGYHYADIDRQLFVCDDCYNRYFSIDLAIPPPVH